MEKIRKDRHQSHTYCDITTLRTTSRVSSHENRLRQGLTNYHDVRHYNSGAPNEDIVQNHLT